jgi:hypothetical protein
MLHARTARAVQGMIVRGLAYANRRKAGGNRNSPREIASV